MSCNYGNNKISEPYVPLIEEALAHWRSGQLQSFGVTEAAVKPFMLERKPDSELKKEAVSWHAEALEVAEVLQRRLGEFSRSTIQSKRGL